MVAINGGLKNAIKRKVGPHLIGTPKPINPPGGGVKTIPMPKKPIGSGMGGVKKPPVASRPEVKNKPKNVKDTGIKKKPPLTPLQKYLLGDSTYVGQLAQFNKAQGDFLADQGLDRAEYLRGYTNTARDIGLAKTEGTRDIKDEYAGRGLLRSGVFNTAYGDMGRKFLNQQTDLSNQKTGFMTRLQQEQLKFKNEQAIAKQQALSDAARRRAEKLNL